MELVLKKKQIDSLGLQEKLDIITNLTQVEKINLSEMFNNIFDNFQNKIQKYYVNLDIRIHALPQIVQGDKNLMQQFMNLMLEILIQNSFGKIISIHIECEKNQNSQRNRINLYLQISVKNPQSQKLISLVEILNARLYNINIEWKKLQKQFTQDEILVKHLVNCLRGSVKVAEINKSTNLLTINIMLSLDLEKICIVQSKEITYKIQSVRNLNLQLNLLEITEESLHSENVSSNDETNQIEFFIQKIKLNKNPGDLFRKNKEQCISLKQSASPQIQHLLEEKNQYKRKKKIIKNKGKNSKRDHIVYCQSHNQNLNQINELYFDCEKMNTFRDNFEEMIG